jgi:hypothetical protein
LESSLDEEKLSKRSCKNQKKELNRAQKYEEDRLEAGAEGRSVKQHRWQGRQDVQSYAWCRKCGAVNKIGRKFFILCREKA